jgi:hypothetical protein
VEYQKGVTGANVERAVFSNDSALISPAGTLTQPCDPPAHRYITPMPSNTDFPARGKVIRVDDSFVVFAPSDTNYEIKLATATKYNGPVGTLIEAAIHTSCRKLWTVTSGGNFVAPIFGPPRIVQGRIKFLDQSSMVLHSGVSVVVKLPALDSAFDLSAGALSVGTLVNATILPGATFELLTAAVR